MGDARDRGKKRRSLARLTILLSEADVSRLLEMKEVVSWVEEAFRREGLGEATNVMRTRATGESSIQSVMHANLRYLRRSGVKAYVSSRAGTKFVIVLFDTDTGEALAVMGADNLGRFRTGAASGVATKHLYGKPSGTLALFGTGRQALTQALAATVVMSVEEVRTWSPNAVHKGAFARLLEDKGFKAKACVSPSEALDGAQVVTAITSSAEPFLTAELLRRASHVNVCGGNHPGHAELTADAVGSFPAVVVDDITQGKVEYGDLIMAEKAGAFSWASAVGLGDVVAGRAKARGRTLFKSGGAAIEDVAVASALYDRVKSDSGFTRFQLD
jgi:alanine dehydrogenase